MPSHGYSSSSYGGSSGSSSGGSTGGSSGSTGGSASSGGSTTGGGSTSESSYSPSGGYTSSSAAPNQTLNTVSRDFFDITVSQVLAEQEVILGELRTGLPTPPPGMHYMDNGELMLGTTHPAHSDPDPQYKAARQYNGGQSDYNLKTSARLGQAALYSDLPLVMRVHPELHDVRPLKDIAAVKQAVKTLVLSGIYDRPFRPDLGCSLTDYLFEPAGATTSIPMANEIKRILQEKEPRIANINVQLVDNLDRNAYDCTISFTVIQTNTQEDVNLYLERVK